MSSAPRQALVLIPASPADISTIQSLARRIWYDCYPGMITRQQIEYMLELMYSTQVIEKELASGTVYELAYRGTEAIGYVSYSLEEEGRQLTLHKLYVVRELQGRGLGQQLLEHVKRQACELNATQISLRVNRGNETAIKAYQRAGFVIASTDVADIGGGFVMDDYIMRCELPRASQ